MWTLPNDKIRQFFWSRKDSTYLDAKPKVFKKDNNKEFRPLKKLSMGEADFYQFVRKRNQLVVAAENMLDRKTGPQL